MTIHVEAKGLEQEIRLVNDMIDRAKNLQPVMAGRAGTFETMIQKDVFGKSQDPSGNAWPELADSTKELRRGGKYTPLDDTGRLKGLVFAEPTQRGLRFGVSDVEGKANAHLFGYEGSQPVTPAMRGFFAGRLGVFLKKETKSVRKFTPQRRYLPITDSGETDFRSGPAAAWAERTRRRVIRYVETGEV